MLSRMRENECFDSASSEVAIGARLNLCASRRARCRCAAVCGNEKSPISVAIRINTLLSNTNSVTMLIYAVRFDEQKSDPEETGSATVADSRSRSPEQMATKSDLKIK